MNRLGIDIGRVIIDSPPGEDTAFFHGDQATVLRTPGVPGAFEAITRLVELFDGQAWLVSKCGPRIQQRSLDWLHHHHFFTRPESPKTTSASASAAPTRRSTARNWPSPTSSTTKPTSTKPCAA